MAASRTLMCIRLSLLKRTVDKSSRTNNPSRNLTNAPRTPQHSLPASYYRGGTSRAIFFHQDSLPKDRASWAPIFRGAIGSPDPHGRQLDGLGGGVSSLSKICVVGPSTHPDADVDYTFAAVGVKDSEVDYSSNCGNMTSAVGPYAVDSKIFSVVAGTHEKVTVRIHNTNTAKIIHSTFPVVDGEAESRGSFAIDGVAGEAARIQLDFIDPAGSRTGELLPTGATTDTFDGMLATCVDVGNPCCFVRAAAVEVDGRITPEQMQEHPTLLTRLDSIRRQAGMKMGLARSTAEVPGSVPKICLVSPPTDRKLASGQSQEASHIDIMVRAMSVGQPHRALPITVALSIAVAAKLPGSVVNECVSEKLVDPAGITIGHASGKLMVGSKYDSRGDLSYATVFRTARRLMEGKVFWK